MPDKRTVLAVVGGIAFTLIASVIGVILLTALNHDIPDILKEMAVGALGALAGVLARTNTEAGPIQPVNVVNTPAAPVPTDPQPGYQPDPHLADQQAKAARLAHAKQALATGAMSGPSDAAVFRSDMHDVARRAAIGPPAPINRKLKRPVPSCGHPPL